MTDRFALEHGGDSPCGDITNYCGGTFRGIGAKLDYIQGLGANAIWISPIPKQTDKGYHGYWQQDITQINPHFGSSDDLKELVNECHKRDIWVMLDVVANHMGNQKQGDWNNFSFFVPFNQSQYYHPYCLINNFNDQHMVEVCRLANLPDLDQSNTFVRSTLKKWIYDTVHTYGFDGIRVDSVPEVPKDFWSEYTSSAGVYSVGEVFNGDPSYVSGYQGPLAATLNYPMYFKLKSAFQDGGSMHSIHDGVTQNAAMFKDVSILGNFLDNHDNVRFLNENKDWNVLKNALAYVIFAEGIPIIYYGTEQGFNGGNDPQNRHSLWPHYDQSFDLYQYISTLVGFRKKAGASLYQAKQVERYVDDQFFAFTRDKLFVATTNIGSGQSLTRTITYHPYSDGTILVNVLDSGQTTVSGGKFDVNIQNGMPAILYPRAQ